MSKKLNVSEISILSNVINEKLNDVKYEKIKGKLEKDVDYKKLEKLSKEINELNNKLKEKNSIYNEINSRIRNKFNISNVIKNGDEVKVYFNSNNYNKIYNDLMLMNIGREINVDEIVNIIIKKYS